MKLIPAIDLRGGRTVRLYQGDYERETVYDAAPEGLAERYAAAGIATLHVVDLDGARTGAPDNLRAIERIVKVTALAIQCGGGIRSRADLERLFDAGVARAVVGSLAVEDPDRVGTWIGDAGSDRICVAFDVRPDDHGAYRLATAGWTRDSRLELHEGLGRFAGSGLQHVLCTDIARDGTLAGPNVALYEQLVEAWPAIRFQASGGVAGLESLRALATTGADAAIVGRALLEGRFTIEEAVACLRDG